MTTVAVLGAGYAGAKAAQSLDRQLSDRGTELVWVSDCDYHLVLHEAHRVVRDPEVADAITVPVAEIAPGAEFVEGTVDRVDVEERTVAVDDARDVEYDYALVALGSETAFYGIPGVDEHAHTLKTLDDALGIHEAVVDAAASATHDDPARVVVGGAGLSGVQTAGEVAEYRDHHDAPVEVRLVEALEEVFPGNDESVQRALRRRLADADVTVTTGDPVTEVTADELRFDEGDPLECDVFVWTGGITGCEPLESLSVDREEHSNRVLADVTFRTSDERVFAVGDAAVIEGADGDDPAPPTAQAAWQAADVAAGNLLRAMDGRSLERWRYEDKGTLVSVGERAVAHDVMFMPVDTFGSLPAVFLKKFVAARWIADMSDWRTALGAWSAL
ncbi:NADH dehydrogenase FAD-containing subunit [Halobacteriales archaeon SW_7_71_33]|nr:MAG: NADH dehydrogenase FAD-containing subunit [Halobacteriales archaeon SW_7_71_33]